MGFRCLIRKCCIHARVTIVSSQMEKIIQKHWERSLPLYQQRNTIFPRADLTWFQVQFLYFQYTFFILSFNYFFKIFRLILFSFCVISPEIFLSRILFVVHLKSADIFSENRTAGEGCARISGECRRVTEIPEGCSSESLSITAAHLPRIPSISPMTYWYIYSHVTSIYCVLRIHTIESCKLMN